MFAVVFLAGCPKEKAEPQPKYPSLAEATPPSATSTVWLGGKGGPNQVLEVVNMDAPPPTITVSLYREDGGGAGGELESWSRVDDLATAGPTDKVFSVEVRAGSTTLIHFGDGEHGAMPRKGDKVFRIRFAGGQPGKSGGTAVRALDR